MVEQTKTKTYHSDSALLGSSFSSVVAVRGGDSDSFIFPLRGKQSRAVVGDECDVSLGSQERR